MLRGSCSTRSFRVSGFEFRGLGSGFGFRVSGFEFRGLGSGVWGLGLGLGFGDLYATRELLNKVVDVVEAAMREAVFVILQDTAPQLRGRMVLFIRSSSCVRSSSCEFVLIRSSSCEFVRNGPLERVREKRSGTVSRDRTTVRDGSWGQ